MNRSRFSLAVLTAILLLIFAPGLYAMGGGHRASSGGPKTVYVHGYTRKDGTYVAPHYRSAPGTASTYTEPASTPTSTTPYFPEASSTSSSSKSTVYFPEETAPPKTTQRPSTRTGSTQSPRHYKSSTKTHRTYTHTTTRTPTYQSSTTSLPERDARGRFVRSSTAKHRFMSETGYPHGRPGYVVDHVVALCAGGRDDPSNMQWQTIAEAKAKDKIECAGHRQHRAN